MLLPNSCPVPNGMERTSSCRWVWIGASSLAQSWEHEMFLCPGKESEDFLLLTVPWPLTLFHLVTHETATCIRSKGFSSLLEAEGETLAAS